MDAAEQLDLGQRDAAVDAGFAADATAADATATDAGFQGPNNPPVANAGSDQAALIGDQVQLNGAGSSDPDNDPLVFTWTLMSAPLPTLSFTATGAHTIFRPTWNGRFEFDLTVSDGRAESHDTVVLMVDCRPAENVAGYSDAQATLAEINPPPTCLDYLITADTIAPAAKTLTIAAGVRVAVGPNLALGADSGNFIAVGTATTPIWIGGTTAGRGSWQGLRFQDAPNAQLIYATVEGGGAPPTGSVDPTAGVSASGSTSLLIEHSTIKGSSGYGASVGLYSLIENFYGDTFTDNALGALEVEINQVNKLGSDSTYTGNSVEQVRVRGTDLNTPSTWSSLGVPFVVGEPGQDTITIGRDFRLEAGASIEVLDSAGIEMRLPNTTFESFGEAAMPARIQGHTAGTGTWRGLVIRGGAHADLRNTVIDGGGAGAPWSPAQSMGDRADLTVLAADPATVVSLSSTTLSGSANQSLWIEQSHGVQVSCMSVTAAQPIVPACPYSN